MAVIRKRIGEPKSEKKLSRKKKAELLTYAAAMHFSKRNFGVNLEQGVNLWGKNRADILAMNLRSDIVIGEVKSCYADFRTDKKWKDYLPYCNKFYFIIFDSDLKHFEKHFDEFKELGIGLLVLSTDLTHKWYGWLYVAFNAKWRRIKGKIKKSIICRMAWRGSQYNRRNMRRYRLKLY